MRLSQMRISLLIRSSKGMSPLSQGNAEGTAKRKDSKRESPSPQRGGSKKGDLEKLQV